VEKEVRKVDVKFSNFGPLLQEFAKNNLEEMRCQMGDKGKAFIRHDFKENSNIKI
jgi:adenine specific DNA methylase Mod